MALQSSHVLTNFSTRLAKESTMLETRRYILIKSNRSIFTENSDGAELASGDARPILTERQENIHQN
jgi:hypothetical protein